MLWVALILAALLIVLALLLPTNITEKISGIEVGIGLIFTGYGIYLNYRAQKKDARMKQIDRDNEYWMKIFSTFIEQPKLNDMHQQIYGYTIPTEEHSMFSMMMQIVENITEGEEYDIIKMDESWKNAISKWIHHPNFSLYWIEKANEFSLETQRVIRELMKE